MDGYDDVFLSPAYIPTCPVTTDMAEYKLETKYNPCLLPDNSYNTIPLNRQENTNYISNAPIVDRVDQAIVKEAKKKKRNLIIIMVFVSFVLIGITFVSTYFCTKFDIDSLPGPVISGIYEGEWVNNKEKVITVIDDYSELKQISIKCNNSNEKNIGDNESINFTKYGDKSCKITAINKNNKTSTVSIYIDISAPILMGVKENIINDGVVQFNDDESGLKRVRILNEKKHIIYYKEFNEKTTESEYKFSEEGKYTIYLLDNANNEQSFNVVYDITPPEIDMENYSCIKPNTAITITDTLSGLQSVKFYMHNTKYPSFDPYLWGQTSVSYVPTPYYYTTDYKVEVIDRAGNKKTYTVCIFMDTPTITGIDKTTNKIIDGHISTTGNSLKVINNRNKFEYVSSKEVFLTEEGEYTIIATDVVNNNYTLNSVYFDNTPPEILNCVNESWISATTNHIVSAYDNGSGMEALIVRYQRATIEITKSFSFSKFSVGGRYEFSARDKAGNVSNECIINVDSEPPIISGNLQNEKYVRSAEITNVIDYDSGLALFSIIDLSNDKEILDLHDLKKANYKYVFEKDGKYSVTATDKVGNSVTYKVLLDNVEPILENITDNQWVKINSIVLFSSVESGISVTIQSGENSINLSTQQIKEGYRFGIAGEYIISIISGSGVKTKYTIYVDGYSPIITGVQNKVWYKPGIEASIIDNDSGLGLIMITNINTGIKVFETDLLGNSYIYKFETEGKFFVEAQDKTGNKVELDVYIDSSAPIINIPFADSSSEWVKSGEVSATDNCSGMKSLIIEKIDELNPDKKIEVHNSINNYIINEEGNFIVTASDNLDNETTMFFKVDLTPPIFNKEDNQWVNFGTIVTVNDKGSGLKELTVKNSKLTVKKNSEAYYQFGDSVDGPYTLTAIDYVGNINTIVINYDRCKPKINGLTSIFSFIKEGTVSVTDSVSGIEWLRVTKYTSDIDSELVYQGIKPYSFLDEGKYKIIASDRANNLSDEYTVIVDKKGPEILNLVNNAWYFEIKLEAIDNLSGVEKFYYLKAGNLNPTKVENGFLINTEGTYEIYALDNSKNSSKVYNVHVDRTGPKILKKGKGFYTQVNTAEISFYDEGSGLKEIVIYDHSSGQVKRRTTADTFKFDDMPDGVYKVYAYDNVGNKSSDTTDAIVNLYTKKPYVQLNKDIKATDGEEITILAGDSITVRDNIPITQITIKESGTDNIIDSSKSQSSSILFTCFSTPGRYEVISINIAGSTSVIYVLVTSKE